MVARNATARPTQLEDLLNPIKVVNLEKKILVASFSRPVATTRT